VLHAYGARCAVTGWKLINGGGRAEAQAAHIRPVERGGPDSVQNGIALSGTAHWMFDREIPGKFRGQYTNYPAARSINATAAFGSASTIPNGVRAGASAVSGVASGALFQGLTGPPLTPPASGRGGTCG
jgi:hypothetical protein